MLFTVSQISPQVELVFANADEFINVYPAYHQNGDLIYANVDTSAWSPSGSEYIWETTYPGINDLTIPVIQLVYSYNATPSERQNQYQAFLSIKAVETTDGKLSFYAAMRPSVNFRIRYRRLDRMDLAISLNRPIGTGIGSSIEYDQINIILTATNPINNQPVQFMCNIPEAKGNKAGIISGNVLARLNKLEDVYNQSLTQPYRIDGYASAGAATPISTYYADITSVQSVSQDTWYKECSIYTQTAPTDFTTAYQLFYQQQATSLDLTHIYTSNVETFSYALAANVLLQEIKGLHLLDTHLAEDISYMFADDVALESLDLSYWELSRITNIEGLFKNCTSLSYIDVSSLDFTKKDSNGDMLIEQADVFTGVPDACTIVVGGQTQYDAIHTEYPNLTGITYN